MEHEYEMQILFEVPGVWLPEELWVGQGGSAREIIKWLLTKLKHLKSDAKTTNMYSASGSGRYRGV